ncbi:UNVERIFIED_CONTAM: Lrrc15 [Trichonephila clavipes]
MTNSVQMQINILITVTVLLIYFPVQPSASDCLHIKNIQCSCETTSAMCFGSQEDRLDVQQLLSNLSNIYSSNDLLDFTLNVTNLAFLPEYTFSDFKIKNLTLGNELRDIYNDLFSGLEYSLLNLNLQYNDIEFVGNPLSSLQNLKRLNLDYNNLEEIDTVIFFNLSKLEFLSVSGNNISSLDSDFLINLPSLQTLILNCNNFPSVSDINIESATLTKLSAQICSIGNSLERDSFSRVSNLKDIDLSSNNINGVESNALNELHSLEIMNLSNNKVEFLRNNAFSSLYNLIELNLKNNKLSLVEENAFRNLTKLKRLDISGNMLEAILQEYTLDLHSLERINLQNNKIKIVTARTFSRSANLQDLQLGGNVLHCSCELSHFASFLINSTLIRPDDINAIVCFSPTGLKNTKLIDVDFHPMNCELDDPIPEEDEDDEEYDDTEIQSTMLVFTMSVTETASVTESSEKITATTATTSSEKIDSTTPLISSDKIVDSTTPMTSSEKIDSTTLAISSEKITDSTIPMNSSISVTSTEVFAIGNYSSTKEDTTLNIEKSSTSAVTHTETTSLISALITQNTFSPLDSTTEFTTLISQSSTMNGNVTTEMISTTGFTTSKFKSAEVSVDILDYSILDNKFCIRWKINGEILSRPTCSVQINSRTGKHFKNIKCPPSGNEIQECIVVDNVYEFCINVYVSGMRKNKKCSKVQLSTTTTESISTILSTVSEPITQFMTETKSNFNFTTISLSSTESPFIPFKIMKFDVTFNHSNTHATAKWLVNKYESNLLCNLTLITVSMNYNHTEGVFDCRNNSYTIQNIKEHETLEICILNFYKGYSTPLLCQSSTGLTYELKASKTKDTGYKNSSLIAVICLLIIVAIIVIALILKNLLKKRTESDMYNVSAEERNVLRRMSSPFQKDPCVRYSYTLKEQEEV